MIDHNNIVLCLDFLIKREFSRDNFSNSTHVSYYDTFKSILLDSGSNDFAKNIIVNSFYSNLKNEVIQVSDFISNSKFINVLNDYNEFCKFFEKTYREEMNKIGKSFSSIFNSDNIENKNEIISYVITESLIEYTNAKKRWIQRTDREYSPHSTKLHKDFISVRSDMDILDILYNKPYGYYIFMVPFQKVIGVKRHNNSICIVSNQSDGITFFDLNAKILGRCGLQGNSYSLETITKKEHKIKMIEKDKLSSTQLSIENKNVNDFDTLDIINKLVSLSFISLASQREEIEKIKNKNKTLIFNKSNEEKTLLPVLTEFKSEELPCFTFEELRFRGKYSFLSKLDDMFESVLDMNKVNFSSNSNGCYFHIEMHRQKSHFAEFQTLETKMVDILDFNFEQFNQFDIKEIKFEDGGVGIEKSVKHITPMNNTMIGNHKDIREQCFKIAKMNKLTMYCLFISFYHELYMNDYLKECKEFFMTIKEDIFNDIDFLSLINSCANCKNSPRNHSKFNKRHKSIVISNETDYLFDFNHKDHTLKSYLGKNNATWLFGMVLNNVRVYEFLSEKYGFKLSEQSQFFIDLYLMTSKLKDMYDEAEIKNKTRRNFLGHIDTGIDIELQNWIFNEPPINLIIPMTNAQNKRLSDNFTALGVDIKQRLGTV